MHGATVAILADATGGRPFYLARVREVFPDSKEVHWYHNVAVDGRYTLEYEAKKGKGCGPASIATIPNSRILCTVTSVVGCGEKLKSKELQRVLELARRGQLKRQRNN